MNPTRTVASTVLTGPPTANGCPISEPGSYRGLSTKIHRTEFLFARRGNEHEHTQAIVVRQSLRS